MFESIIAGVLGNFVWFIILLLVGGCITLWWKFIRIKRSVSRMMGSGISEFFPDRDSYIRDRKLSLEDYLKTASHDLTYIGHWLAVSLDQRNTLDTIKIMLQSGKRINFILLNQDLQGDTLALYARFFGKSDADFRFHIQSGWNTIKQWRSSLGESEEKRLTIKSHSEFICHSAFIFDNGQNKGKILIDQKIWGLDRKNSFGFELSSNKEDTGERTLFKRYSESLQKLADRADVVN